MTELDRFLDDLTDWVASRPDVLGLALVGSHAHGTARPESDVDIIMLCEQPALLVINSDDWIARFGQPLKVLPEVYGIVRALRVFYRDGMEVEFGLNPMQWVSIPLDAGTRRVISDGMRILYDPAGLLQRAESAATK